MVYYSVLWYIIACWSMFLYVVVWYSGFEMLLLPRGWLSRARKRRRMEKPTFSGGKWSCIRAACAAAKMSNKL